MGEWNSGRIVVRGAHVEHWMNEVKLLEYELWTDEWREIVANTKFSDWPGYGMARTGYIGLQDHGDPVWYRKHQDSDLLTRDAVRKRLGS